MCLMNMFLHNIGEIDGGASVSPNDALIAPSDKTDDYVLANPPFGKKSSMSFANEEGEQQTDELTYKQSCGRVACVRRRRYQPCDGDLPALKSCVPESEAGHDELRQHRAHKARRHLEAEIELPVHGCVEPAHDLGLSS